VNVVNDGLIQTSLGYGVEVEGGNMTIRNAGTIESGIAAQGFGHSGIFLSGNNVDVDNEGAINTFSDDSHGIHVLSSDEAPLSFVDNYGTITTVGEDADGLVLRGGSFDVTNGSSGGISTTGASADGIVVGGRSAGGSNLVWNFGEIVVADVNSRGVRLDSEAGEETLLVNFNTGTITAPDMAVIGGGGNDTVRNYGVINGDVWLQEGDDVFAKFDDGVVNGEVNGGALGNDFLIVGLTENQTLDGSRYVDFENLGLQGVGQVTLTNALSIAVADLGAGSVIMSDGSSLSGDVNLSGSSLGGNGSIGGTLDAGAGKLGPGTSTGILDIAGDLLLTGADLELEAYSVLDTDILRVGGDVLLDGGLMTVVLGYTPDINDVLSFFMVTGSFDIGSGFEGIRGIAAQGSGVAAGTKFLVDLGGVIYEGQVVPVPAALWLFGSCLLALGGLGRRRRAASTV